MFEKILIANRGEIALRIICACKELGIKTVAVYSEADRYSLHVRFADEAVCIGPPRSADSYLNVASIISAAEITGAEAIHPGYGFLAESAYFAEVCQASNLTFIGPSPEAMRMMGDKNRARRAMAELGLPVLPGSEVIRSEAMAQEEAERAGYPVMVKAAAGGGGRGMRIVRTPEELSHAIQAAQNEAAASFGTPDVYLEKYIESPRHIEFQVLGDSHGNMIHLGERECTIQRRHQKLVEESPSTQLDQEARERVGSQVVQALTKIGYTNAGTVEFLMDGNGKLYFLEMNTRIQVEHAVTEMVTGVDLVKAQFQIAAGGHLDDFGGKSLRFRGHAIECRICAENPRTFAPSAGKVTAFHPPGGTGVRVDTAAYAESVIPPYYDSLIAKLVVCGNNRSEAIDRMARALEMFIIEGISTIIPLHQKIMADADFRAGKFDTHFLNRFVMNGDNNI